MRTNNNQRSIGRTIISNNVFVGATRNGDVLRGNSGTATDKDLFLYILRTYSDYQYCRHYVDAQFV